MSDRVARRRRIRLLGLTYLYLRKKRQTETKRKYWVHPLHLTRPTQGAWHTCMAALREHYPDKHREAFRMDIDTFNELLDILRDSITRQDTFFRKAISPDQRLGITIYYLATGDSFPTIALFFRIGRSTARRIIFETCDSIWDCCKTRYMITPSTNEQWKKVATDFHSLWDLPHCLGAIDGKHCAIQCPNNTGSEYFNYKKFFSIVLLAMCDANYNFLYVDVGTSGRWSDGGTWEHCSLNQSIVNNQLQLPPEEPLKDSDVVSPYFFVADEAFPLKTWLMRPIPGSNVKEIKHRIYNYRLSRARRTIENAFGITVSRWRVLKRTLHMTPQHANKVILACCVLHNMMRKKSPATYTPPGYADVVYPNGEVVDGAWRDGERDHGSNLRAVPRRSTRTALEVRDALVGYLNGPGAVEWQEAWVNRTG